MTNLNLEKDFISVDILWIMHYTLRNKRKNVKLGLNINIEI